MKVFISYCHKQGEWVLDHLSPCLRAAGVEVLIDVERFEAGKGVYSQMDAAQDQADRQILVFSQNYLDSAPCKREMLKAFAINKNTGQELYIPIIRKKCSPPPEVKKKLYINFVKDDQEDPWNQLFRACQVELGLPAPKWLEKRNDLRDKLRNNESVNLVVNGEIKWRLLLQHLKTPYLNHQKIPDFKVLDLFSGSTANRLALVRTIIGVLGGSADPPAGGELTALDSFIAGSHGLSRLMLFHMDCIKNKPDYDSNLFSALCHLVNERHLQLLMVSMDSLANLLPGADLRLPSLTSLANICQTVEFK